MLYLTVVMLYVIEILTIAVPYEEEEEPSNPLKSFEIENVSPVVSLPSIEKAKGRGLEIPMRLQ